LVSEAKFTGNVNGGGSRRRKPQREPHSVPEKAKGFITKAYT
jgi:hypothetical protein